MSDSLMPAVGAMGIVTSGLGLGVATSDGCEGGVARYISSRRLYNPTSSSESETLSYEGHRHTFTNLESTIWAFGMSQDIVSLYGKWHSICCRLANPTWSECEAGTE
jgi:hypothetical protein